MKKTLIYSITLIFLLFTNGCKKDEVAPKTCKLTSIVYNDDLGNPSEKEEYIYDNAGRLIEIAYSDINTGEKYTPYYILYDDEGRAIKIDNSYDEPFHYTWEVSFTYTGDVITQAIQREGSDQVYRSIYTYEYDAEGRIVKEINDEGYVDIYTYDAKGNVIEIWDDVNKYTRMFKYDNNPNVFGLIDLPNAVKYWLGDSYVWGAGAISANNQIRDEKDNPYYLFGSYNYEYNADGYPLSFVETDNDGDKNSGQINIECN